MQRMLIAVMLLVGVTVAGCSKGEKAPPGGATVKEGASAPDFTLKDLAGRDVTLASLRGKVVFLNFWATWCPPCREEIPSMMRLNQAMAGKPFQMLAVAIDDGGPAPVEAFLGRSGFNLPVLMDPGQEISRIYGITGVPETFVIDKKGLIRKKVIGGMEWSSPEAVRFFTDLAAQ